MRLPRKLYAVIGNRCSEKLATTPDEKLWITMFGSVTTDLASAKKQRDVLRGIYKEHQYEVVQIIRPKAKEVEE